MITYGGPEILLLFVIFIVTPILYRKYLKKLKRKKRIICISSLWTVTFLIGYTDVIYISLKARKLCREEAGLHVYKTVEAEGFLGSTSIENWSKYGFRYVESIYKDRKKTIFILKDGKVVSETVPEFISRYEYTRDSQVLKVPFEREQDIIRDRQTGEILGDLVVFYVYPGWLDSRLMGLLGLSWSPPRCDGDYKPWPQKATLYYTDLVKAVIKPKPETQGEQP
jgi:hypothetical protein